MSGSSYGGAIQFVTAAIDRRIDAITPTIAWHTLVRSLFTSGDVKAGWGAALCGLGQVNGLAPGLIGPGGFQAGSVDPHVTSACVQGTSTGQVSRENVEWFRDRGPLGLVRRIRAPALVIQGSVDTLFTLQEAIDNFRLLRETGVPLRTMWFCGGHGACLTGTGTRRHIERRVIAWFDRWLKTDSSAGVGPRFEWVADDDRWRSAGRFPLPRLDSLHGRGAGVLPLSPQPSGALVLATPVQGGALDVPIESADRAAELLGAPEVELTYRGTAQPASTHVYAQIVDEQRNIVVSNQATPIRVTLDGQRRRVAVRLAPIAAHATPGDDYRLQIVASTTLFYPQTSAGALTAERVDVRLAIVGTSGTGGGGGAGGGSGRTIEGTAGNDVIRCGPGDDRVDAGGGNDVVRCGSGDDVVFGGSGNDRLFGESGDDRLAGGSGNDLVDGGSGDDRVAGSPGTDRTRGGSGSNTQSG
jgi:ABC-2 type transport system ATP-binding protein